MGLKYTENEIKDAWKSYFNKTILNLYDQEFVKHTGTCKGSGTFYTELVAKLIMDNGIVKKLSAIEPITRKVSYRIKNRNNEDRETNRHEERMAKKMCSDELVLGKLGKAMDYQIPLKNTQKDTAGKIDLFAYDEATKTIYLIELKGDKSKETALRAVLEIATYYQLLDKGKFLEDYKEFFKEHNIKTTITNIKKAVLFCEGTSPAKEVKEKRKHLSNLMKELDVEYEIFNPSKK